MRSFYVLLKRVSYSGFTIEAADEDDARERARDRVLLAGLDLVEWEKEPAEIDMVVEDD